MNIHNIINAKEWVSECNNVLNKNKKPIPECYNLVGLVVQGKAKLIEQRKQGSYYCYDCSSEWNKPIYHLNSYPFKEFCNKSIVKRYAKELNELAEVIY